MATKEDFDRIGNYARMYNVDQNIDRSKCTRTVPMEVLALGYSRTGTLSMQSALATLGYANPYHFSSFFDNVQDCDRWVRLIDAKFHGKGPAVCKADFDGLLGHCGAVTDMPCHLFAAELIEYYPDAKVVLVERDMDSWSKSWSTFLGNAMSPILPLLGRLDPYVTGRITSTGVRGLSCQVGHATTLAAAKARSAEEYRKHYALVRSLVNSDRILNFQLKDGWEPLCEFLGKPVPKEPFPHLNDSVANTQGFKELATRGMKRGALRIVTFAGATAITVWALRRAMN